MKATWVLLSAMLCVLCGCTTMDNPGGMGVVSRQGSASDRATVIDMAPNALYDPGSTPGTPLRLGARWTSDASDSVTLVLSYGSTVSRDAPIPSFQNLEISIDGQALSFPASKRSDVSTGLDNPVSHTTYASIRTEVPIPYALLQRMVTSKNCWLRAEGGGYQDAKLSADRLADGKPTAIVSLRQFMAKVDAVRTGGARAP